MRSALLCLVALPAFLACEPAGEPPPEGEGEGEGEVEGGTIAVAPAACDFGRVPVGAIANCTIAIENVGVRDLVLDGGEFLDANDEPDPVSPFLPLVNIGTIAPGASVSIDVRFRPVDVGDVAGALRIFSNDVDTPAFGVALSGIGAEPPVCRVRVKSVNGVLLDVADDVPSIEALDDVVLSIDASSTTSLVRSEWALASQPADSLAELTNSDLPDVGIVVDAPGDYEICAQVFDDLGVGSVNDCCITLHVVNGFEMRAELSEDDADDSLALHVTKRAADGAFCVDGGAGIVSTDCANDRACEASACTPDWDGATATFDDVGLGLETINGASLVDGDYLVSVRSIAPGAGTVRLFVVGQLASELSINAGEPGSIQDLAIVRVAGALTCVEDLTDGDVDDDCP